MRRNLFDLFGGFSSTPAPIPNPTPNSSPNPAPSPSPTPTPTPTSTPLPKEAPKPYSMSMPLQPKPSQLDYENALEIVKKDNNIHARLRVAVYEKKYGQVINSLIKEGAEIDHVDINSDIDHFTLLERSIYENNQERILFLLGLKSNIDRINSYDFTFLETTIYEATVCEPTHLSILEERARFLINRGAKFNRIDDEGYTLLERTVYEAANCHDAASWSNLYKRANFMIRLGANINKMDQNGHTLLEKVFYEEATFASEHIANPYKRAVFLLSCGANINSSFSWRISPKMKDFLATKEKEQKLWDVWEMEIPQYTSHSQWLPQEMLDDIIPLTNDLQTQSSNAAQPSSSSSPSSSYNTIPCFGPNGSVFFYHRPIPNPSGDNNKDECKQLGI